MKSSSPVSAPRRSARRGGRMSAYALPLAVVPSVLIGVQPALPARPDVYSHAGSALSSLGLELDQQVLERRTAVELAPRAREDFAAFVASRQPQSTRRVALRVTRRSRPLRMPEATSELEAVLAHREQ